MATGIETMIAIDLSIGAGTVTGITATTTGIAVGIDARNFRLDLDPKTLAGQAPADARREAHREPRTLQSVGF
jgi:hypothetical protein